MVWFVELWLLAPDDSEHSGIEVGACSSEEGRWLMVDMVMHCNVMGSSGSTCGGCRGCACEDAAMDDVEDNVNAEARWCSWTRDGHAVVDGLGVATGLGRHHGW
jgi:hypothetical protein